MGHPVCLTCGTQFAGDTPPAHCPICEDPRQYVGSGGQRWTTLEAIRRTHRAVVQRVEPSLYGIGMTPDFAIGQRALLVRTPQGNVLWDCIALLDDAIVDLVRAWGGLAAIAISHPHYYSTMVEWAHAFGCPIRIHAADRVHVARPDDAIEFWEGDRAELLPGLTLVRCGGHFEGATVLHHAAGADGRGALLSGDSIQVVSNMRWVSFMRSYPNLIPLPARAVERIVAAVEPFDFERIYGAWWDRQVTGDAKDAVRRSAARYRSAIAE